VVREAAAGEVAVDEAEAAALADEGLREAGGGRDGAHGVPDTRGATHATRTHTHTHTRIHTYSHHNPELQLSGSELQLPGSELLYKDQNYNNQVQKNNTQQHQQTWLLVNSPTGLLETFHGITPARQIFNESNVKRFIPPPSGRTENPGQKWREDQAGGPGGRTRREGGSPEDAAHDHHLAEPRLDGQAGQDASQRRQLVVAVQRVQFWWNVATTTRGQPPGGSREGRRHPTTLRTSRQLTKSLLQLHKTTNK